MKYLGIDYGSKRVGIAVSDERGVIAFPRFVVENNERLPSRIAEIAHDEDVQQVIIGDARASSGLENPITGEAEKFAAELRARGISTQFVPELWSSVEAARYNGGRDHNDASAAAIILQRFLDGLRQSV